MKRSGGSPHTYMVPLKIELGEQIFLHHLPADTFKSAHLQLHFVVPIDNERAASHRALIPAVLRRGCERYPTQTHLSRHLEDLYSADFNTSISRRGDMQIITFDMGMLQQDYIPEGLDILPSLCETLKSILFHPLCDKKTGVFLEEYVESEKKNAIDAIRAQLDNKAYYARIRCIGHMCRNEKYGISEFGTVKEIEAITPVSLYEAYRSLLAEAKIMIYYTGSESFDTVRDTVSSLFVNVRRIPCSLFETEQNPIKLHVKKIKESAKAKQGKLCLGFRVGTRIDHPLHSAMSLFLYVFGASPTSKLFANVREKLSLCYSCSARQELTKGILLVTAGIENTKYRRALREIRRQFRFMKAGKITEEELLLSKNILAGQFRSVSDDPQLLVNWYFVRDLSGISETPEEAADAVMRVSLQELCAVASTVRLDTVYFLRGSLTARKEKESDEE